jgi:hypothetical protein
MKSTSLEQQENRMHKAPTSATYWQIVDSKTNSLVMECKTKEQAQEELKLFFADGKKTYVIVESVR